MARTTIVRADTTNFPVYETADLDLFQRILDDTIAELEASDPALAGDPALRIRVAAALFKCAENGERDYVVLKRAALASMFGPGTSTH